jgi:hypothetical protein
MKVTAIISLSFALIMICVSAEAVPSKAKECRVAIREKQPCRGQARNTPARALCNKAAMERCKAQGFGAI